MIDRFDELLARPISTRSLAVVRIAVGALTVVHLWPLARAASGGNTHHGRFHEPYVEVLARIPAGPYTAIMWVGVLAAMAMAIGLVARVSTAIAFATVAFHLLISTTHVHNNRAYLVTILLILSMSPCGRSWSIDRWWSRQHDREAAELGPAWTLWLLRFACATVYFASGFGKLVDPDWFGGTVTWGRVTVGEADLRASPLPDGVVDLILNRTFHSVVAPAIVFTELFVAVGLWWRRFRPWAVGVAIVFHVMIEISANVQLFSWLAVAVLVVWADPDLSGLGTLRPRRRPTGVPA